MALQHMASQLNRERLRIPVLILKLQPAVNKILRRRIYLLLALIALLAPLERASGEQYEETFTYGMDMSARSGCLKAEERLKLKAIADACGSNLSGTSIRELGDNADQFYRLYVEQLGGKIVKYEEIGIPIPENLACTVRANVEVVCEIGKRDSGFLPNPETIVALNQTAYDEDDYIQISIETPRDSTDGYYFLNIATLVPRNSDQNQVTKIFPNELQRDNRLKIGNRSLIPNGDYDIRAKLPEGEEKIEETLLFIFTKDKFILPQNLSMLGLNRLLAEIELSKRREVFLTYSIKKRD